VTAGNRPAPFETEEITMQTYEVYLCDLSQYPDEIEASSAQSAAQKFFEFQIAIGGVNIEDTVIVFPAGQPFGEEYAATLIVEKTNFVARKVNDRKPRAQRR
jgi:hypothetical protein